MAHPTQANDPGQRILSFAQLLVRVETEIFSEPAIGTDFEIAAPSEDDRLQLQGGFDDGLSDEHGDRRTDAEVCVA
ncbi:hypothetical protein [Rhodoplanes sp. Z2-YC6860]|uniref:hypothetical protein n=1 Tax=Rhodoplanes sp. Z2-YC6860 TaxID=674703 RepID=UPI0012ECC653|nr:hypothetical protein [Rhodoplanes sp. Z2-YC6860]